ncbi:hypothetical protein [Chryseobacterium echinoideorum]|uniref:hypothetical protein n=1 Tax=Chryseobacterium echinoideorum TaxID=1549648 RepID=UPI001E61BBAD|nr:hypothetical protein [Chryseobacterium echinoideorum]
MKCSQNDCQDYSCFRHGFSRSPIQRQKGGERDGRTDADEKLSLLHQWGQQSGTGSGLLQIHLKK